MLLVSALAPKLALKIGDLNGDALPTKQARVVIHCSDKTQFQSGEPNTIEEGYNWHFSRSFYREFIMTMPRKPLLPTSSGTNTTFGFIDYFDPDLPDDITASAVFWMRGSPNPLNGNPDNSKHNHNTRLCLVDARWRNPNYSPCPSNPHRQPNTPSPCPTTKP